MGKMHATGGETDSHSGIAKEEIREGGIVGDGAGFQGHKSGFQGTNRTIQMELGMGSRKEEEKD